MQIKCVRRNCHHVIYVIYPVVLLYISICYVYQFCYAVCQSLLCVELWWVSRLFGGGAVLAALTSSVRCSASKSFKPGSSTCENEAGVGQDGAGSCVSDIFLCEAASCHPSSARDDSGEAWRFAFVCDIVPGCPPVHLLWLLCQSFPLMSSSLLTDGRAHIPSIPHLQKKDSDAIYLSLCLYVLVILNNDVTCHVAYQKRGVWVSHSVPRLPDYCCLCSCDILCIHPELSRHLCLLMKMSVNLPRLSNSSNWLQ